MSQAVIAPQGELPMRLWSAGPLGEVGSTPRSPTSPPMSTRVALPVAASGGQGFVRFVVVLGSASGAATAVMPLAHPVPHLLRPVQQLPHGVRVVKLKFIGAPGGAGPLRTPSAPSMSPCGSSASSSPVQRSPQYLGRGCQMPSVGPRSVLAVPQPSPTAGVVPAPSLVLRSRSSGSAFGSLVTLPTVAVTSDLPQPKQPSMTVVVAGGRRGSVRARWLEAAKCRRTAAENGRRSCAGRSLRGSRSYEQLVEEARREVPPETARQIHIDIPRTFGALPPELAPAASQQQTMEQALERILLAAEWFNTNAVRTDLGATYTQGMNYVAAMCLVNLWDIEEIESEELAFWLFDLLLVDALGVQFFAEWPPLLGYHASASVLRGLVPSVCPTLSSALCEETDDFISMLSCRFFVPCFVGLLPVGPLLALWDELVEGVQGVFPKRPLFHWFIALLRSLESDLSASLSSQPPHEPRAPAAYQQTLKRVGSFPPTWRPQSDDVCPSAQQLRRSVNEAERRLSGEAADLRLVQFGILPADRVAALHREFALLPSEQAGEGISPATLHRILRRAGISLGSDGHETAAVLFRLLDRDGSGCLDFLELMTGLLMMSSGHREQKLRFIFDLYDTDASGCLGSDELLCLAQALVKVSTGLPTSNGRLCDGEDARSLSRASSEAEFSAAEKLRQRLMILDTDGDGRISWDEFRAAIDSQPQFMHVLARAGLSMQEQTKCRSVPRHLLPRRMVLWAACCGGGGSSRYATSADPEATH